jgi:uncharacterized membrane protein YgcG
LSAGVPEVLQLEQAKVSDGIIVNYIQNSGTIYALDANQIVYLKQQGVSDAALNAMINQRSRLTGSTEPASPAATTSTAAQTSATTTASTTSYVSTPSSTVYVVPDTQTVQYDNWYYSSYPYYSYYPYPVVYPAVSLSFGFGGYYRGGYYYHGGYYHGGGGWHGGGGGWHH